MAPLPPCLEPDLPSARLASHRGTPSHAWSTELCPPCSHTQPTRWSSLPVLRDNRVRPVQRHRVWTSPFTEGSHRRPCVSPPCLSVQALHDPGCTWSQPPVLWVTPVSYGCDCKTPRSPGITAGRPQEKSEGGLKMLF